MISELLVTLVVFILNAFVAFEVINQILLTMLTSLTSGANPI